MYFLYSRYACIATLIKFMWVWIIAHKYASINAYTYLYIEMQDNGQKSCQWEDR